MRALSRFAHVVVSVIIPSLAVAADNVPPPGFTALFDGKGLDGWKGLVADPPARARMSAEELARAQQTADERMRAHWKVEDGALVFDGKGDSLSTARVYADFELLVDWKILPAGDSGLYLRGSPQVQIWDRPEGSGGLYNNQKHPSNPLVNADRPVGEWNSFRIRMAGEKVTVHLNGVLVVDDVVMENYWERDKPIYPTGQIELQNHGNTLWFKNVFVRELTGPPPVPALRPKLRLAITGDSITEQKLYSRYIETYLLACRPDLEARVVQLGWSGERAPGLAARLENDLLPFKPDVVTTCYGMNDGSYRAYEPAIGEPYARAMRDIVGRLKAAGATVVVGSPGAVDTTCFRNPQTPPAVYNDNLAHLRDIAMEIAREEGMPFANVHDAMIVSMRRAKAALGEAYDVCGGDGVHPNANGQLVMAHAFLKALGLDGAIGTITVDLKGTAEATAGHRVVSAAGGTIEVESSRYPFCTTGDGKSPASNRSILPYLAFAEELNRFVLVVRGLDAARARVTWGTAEKSFAKEDLERGINLAAEFPDHPLCAAFAQVDAAVARKQGFETPMIKDTITHLRGVRAENPAAKAAVERLRDLLWEKQEALAAEARAAVRPVRHSIIVKPE